MAQHRVNSLAVILLLTDDTATTARFYRDVLGLALDSQEHDGRHEHYACRTGSVYFTIQCLGDLSGKEPGFSGTDPVGTSDSLQVCFTVPSMEEFLRHLEAVNVTPLHSPIPFEHTVFTTLRDPDGRAVRIMTPWE